MSHNKKNKQANEPTINGKNDIINANRNAEGSLPTVETAGRAKKEKKKY